jgi:hypothetical protein
MKKETKNEIPQILGGFRKVLLFEFASIDNAFQTSQNVSNE